MTKSPTLWTPEPSGTVALDNAGDFLLLETSDNLLLETGDDALLEDTVVSTKSPVAWSEA